jgi:hypothetical protein
MATRAAASGCLLRAGQFTVVTGSVLTAALEGTRFRVWLIAPVVALLAVITVLASLYAMCLPSGRGKGLLFLQLVVVPGVAVPVAWFAFGIPVPPGTRSALVLGGS